MNEIDKPETEIDSEIKFTPPQIRVLGSLIEKAICTPEYYPLTLRSLAAACNQKSNRDPMMQIDDTDLVRILEDLRYDHEIVRQISTAGSRVPKYKHMFAEHYDFTPTATAVLCELFLRGPQTAGQLRTRTARMHQFADSNEVEEVLRALTEWEDGPFVVKLPREPGCRDHRWAHLFCGEIDISQLVPETRAEPARTIVQAENERISALEAEVAVLHEGLKQINAAFAEFRKQFE